MVQKEPRGEIDNRIDKVDDEKRIGSTVLLVHHNEVGRWSINQDADKSEERPT